MQTGNLFHQLFKNLPGVQRRILQQGDVLFHQGDPAELVFTVESGSLRLLRYTGDGSAVSLHTARDGDSFAEAALFTDHYHCNGEVVSDSVIWCYPRRAVLEQLGEDKACSKAMFDQLAAQVRYLRMLLELRSIRSATERTMQLLRLRADQHGFVRLHGNLLDYAQELGLAHETFYRTLASLEKTGQIERIERQVIRLVVE